MARPGIRTTLYVPADRPDRFDKALHSGADAIIVDLEDAVPAAAKDQARHNAADWLAAHPGVAAWIRVNNAEAHLGADLELAASVPCLGVVMAKATPAACAATELAVVALVESAEGVSSLDAMAALPNVERFAIGEADLAADLGMTPSPDGAEFAPIRSQLVVASAVAGLAAPCGPVPTDLSDDAGLAATSELLCRQGFGGRSVIHPKQVGAVNAAFTPSTDDIAWARAVTDAAADANGAVAVVDGEFVDAAVLRRATSILARVTA